MDDEKKLTKNRILYYKIKKMAKRWIKQMNRSKNRKQKLVQWYETEKKYIADLQKMQTTLEQPLLQKGLLNQAEAEKLFANFDGMIRLGKEMEESILNLIKTWHPRQTILSKPLQSLHHYFRIYKPYCNYFTVGTKIIARIQEQNPQQWKEVAKGISPYSFEDYQIKPVARTMKYKLLLKDFFEKMPKDHKDYFQVKQTMDMYHHTVEELNQAKERDEKNEELSKLDVLFGNIIERFRSLKNEFNAYHFGERCRVKVFNDMLLVLKNQEKKPEELTRLHLNKMSFVTKKNVITFENLLFICGKNANIHLSFQRQEDQIYYFEMVSRIIDTLQKNEKVVEKEVRRVIQKRQESRPARITSQFNEKYYEWVDQPIYKFNLRISVIGAHQRNYVLKQALLFVVKVELYQEGIYHILLCELEELKSLKDYLHHLHPRLNIPSPTHQFKGFNSDDEKSNINRYVEYRGFAIESFLNFIFQRQEIIQKPEMMGFKLRIHESFWEYMKRQTLECLCQACNNTNIFKSLKDYEVEVQKLQSRQSSFCELKSFQIQNYLYPNLFNQKQLKDFPIDHQLIYAKSRRGRLNHKLSNPIKYGHHYEITVHIPWFAKGMRQMEIILPFVEKCVCARTIIDYCAEKEGFKNLQDFSLVAYFNEKRYVLDDDQYVIDVVKWMQGEKKKEDQERKTFFDHLTHIIDWSQTFQWKQEAKLKLEKVYFFPKTIEEAFNQQQPKRYPLVIGFMVEKQKKIPLLNSLEEMKLFTAFLFGIQNKQAIEKQKYYIKIQQITDYLPESKHSLVNQNFLINIMSILERLIKHSSETKLYRYIFRQFGDKIAWISEQMKFLNLKPESLPGKHKYLTASINFNKVMLAEISTRKLVIQFPIQSLQYRLYPNLIKIMTEQKDQYSFIGENMIFFDELVQTYKILHPITS